MTFTAVQPYENQTMVTNILLLNFSNDRFFIITFWLSLIYCTILTGNFCIFIIIRVEAHLHTPMYFFLSNLSVLDICYASTTLPIIIFNCATGNKRISFVNCIAQLYLFVSLGGAECILLAVMAYDRYVAICNPLRYPVLLRMKLCAGLAAASWLGGFLDSMLHTVMASKLRFCKSEDSINHFFCDVPPLVHVACNSTKTSKILMYVVSVFLGFTPFLYIVITYFHIISTIMKIKSSEGRSKAFSTCSSHLIIVTAFYSTGILNYIGPRGYSVELENLASLLYSILTPVVNPIIYCLRNKEVKGALRKHFWRSYFMTD
ncbi:olfactory receptor 5V1-like [Aquarana catesbeiana]|uniref:olfactory receptor 5V1-like n=1 Tax=Aquarana catesbeiana TaxID=8400 RepID=UPI003CC9CA74